MSRLEDLFPGREQKNPISRDKLFEAPELVPARGRLEGQARRAAFLHRATTQRMACLHAHDKSVEQVVRDYLCAEEQREKPVMIPEREIRALFPGIEVFDPFDVRDGDGAVLITGCAGAIAETGSLILTSHPERPLAAAFLADTHIVLLSSAQIFASLEDFFLKQKESIPHAVHVISGPSTTADIEMRLVKGAHGPLKLGVVLLDVS
ncbi:LutC/YkgG family protein [Luteithermobacter gelatinilyticus]|uniref:LutC/YkgG family protein n=1 Tax=Luteithermobacter gelatinilyticus TaxID=2582913 RepID=UPI00110744D3|nr:LUD domain-containing protein [Luteithermobacter gelatinilyticus]